MTSAPLPNRPEGDIEDAGTFSATDSPSRRSISPPARKKRRCKSPNPTASLTIETPEQPSEQRCSEMMRVFPSPMQLNKIPDLPAASNVDTVSLRDILGDPLISECWIFNYLFDVDFVM